MTILHMSEPKIHVLVTSQMMEGGAQKSMTRMSARARFTMKMLVTLCSTRMLHGNNIASHAWSVKHPFLRE